MHILGTNEAGLSLNQTFTSFVFPHFTMAQEKCTTCSKEPTPEQKLLQCGRCKTAAYCSTDCQKTDWPTHKEQCKRPNYIIRVRLCPDVDEMSWRLRATITDPPVERTLSCPSTATFSQLHQALQTAFGWATTHTYDFAILDPEYRTVGMEEDEENSMLDMIQRSMGKVNPNSPREYALRMVTKSTGPGVPIDAMHDGQRKHPRTVDKPASSTKLFQVLDTAQCRDGTLVYTYDFGDRWEHLLTVTGREPASTKFRCSEGVGHPVAEDVKQDGWADLKAAYRAQRPNKEQREQMQWFERQASNGDPRGLKNGREHEWDQEAVNARLSVREVR